MFTGIIETVGKVTRISVAKTDASIRISAREAASRLSVGASIAVDGVCVTAVEVDSAGFAVQAMAETLRVTTLGSLGFGDRVNLELPLAVGSPLGGHVVQGHVDEVGTVVEVRSVGEGVLFGLAASADLVAQLVPKGSVAVDGVSLTVGPDLGDKRFEAYLIPHTLEVTTLGRASPGDRVNLEVDILAKTVRRYLCHDAGERDVDWDDLRATVSAAMLGGNDA